VVLQYARVHPGEHITAPVELPAGDVPAGAAGTARLIAFTEHFGSPQRGHFVTSVRAAEGGGPWVRVDDGSVTQTTPPGPAARKRCVLALYRFLPPPQGGADA